MRYFLIETFKIRGNNQFVLWQHIETKGNSSSLLHLKPIWLENNHNFSSKSNRLTLANLPANSYLLVKMYINFELNILQELAWEKSNLPNDMYNDCL